MDKKKKKKDTFKFPKAGRGPTWVGLYPRRTKSRKEKEESISKKHKERYDEREE